MSPEARSHPLTINQATELAALLAPSRLPLDGSVAHPWPHPLPALWSGQFDRSESVAYLRVEPSVVAEIDADVAFEHGRWRHRVRYARARPEMSIRDVPLLVEEQNTTQG